MRGVATLSMMSSTGPCLVAFGMEMPGRSSPVEDILARAPAKCYSDDLGVAKLTSDDMKASCDESAVM